MNEIKKKKKKKKIVQIIFFDIRGFFEIPMFNILAVDCNGVNIVP